MRSRKRLGFSDKQFDALMSALTAADRPYHGLGHIGYMLRLFERFVLPRLDASDAKIVELAIWFHDYIYDTRKKDNELQSANAALEMLDLTAEEGDRLHAMIIATLHVDIAGLDYATRLLVGLDLAILAASWGRYCWYVRGVMTEYDWVPAEIRFGPEGRPKILKHFIGQDDLLADLSELITGSPTAMRDKARANMTRELIQMAA